ncbi:MAG: PCYCGC motif-containing (lipo)protein [Candidatus Hydrothermarchaeales archaeon]
MARRKRVKVKKDRAKKKSIFKTLKSNKVGLVLIGLFLFSSLAYAFLSGGSPSFRKKTVESPQSTPVNLPSYAYTNEKILDGYTKAVEIQDILQWIPCYCGCGGHSNHKSVKNCFIKEDGSFDEHASQCEMCLDIAISSYRWWTEGVPLKEIRERIDRAYGEYQEATPTPQLPKEMEDMTISEMASAPQQTSAPMTAPIAQPEISQLFLKEDFDSLSDGLKKTPSGIFWARFVNVKRVLNTSLEEYASSRVQPDAFYGRKIIGMYSADYPDNTWIELHDLGYNEFNLQSRNSIGITNKVSVRPYIYGHTKNVNLLIDFLGNPARYGSAYDTFEPLVKKFDGNVGIAEVSIITSPFSDMRYVSLDAIGNETERVTAYRITQPDFLPLERYKALQSSSSERGFSDYEVLQEENLFIVRIVSSNLTAVLLEEPSM